MSDKVKESKDIEEKKEKKLPKVRIYADGAAKGNPGVGGFGVHIDFLDKDDKPFYTIEHAQRYPNTTNNKMELLGVITGIEYIKVPSRIDVYSDSSYVIKAFNDKWLDKWQEDNWKSSSGKPVKNVEYWKRLLSAIRPHMITWHWVKGHAGDELNERVDFLASSVADGKLFERDDNGHLVEKTFQISEVDDLKDLETIFDDFMNPPLKD